ncbi:E3 ubiquitin-protein ligase RSL1-like [Apium graveolens]|uniref:E3 ubiquitin-protein ligase RSL1-like n=1 Tax=Apium graveolens TaxID=4045 RepID=UPI003D79FCD9
MTKTKTRYEKFVPEWVSKGTCFICTELVTLPNKMFKNQNKCAHPICVECIIKYIKSKLDQGLHRIKCPVLDCAHLLDPVSCRPDIPSVVFDRWIDLLCEFAVLRIDRCYCPYKECSALILNECGGSTVSKSECPGCKNLFCFSCRVAWHAGHSCEEVRRLSDWNDNADGVLAENEKWQRCPACHHCVERVSGCNYVTCRYTCPCHCRVDVVK